MWFIRQRYVSNIIQYLSNSRFLSGRSHLYCAHVQKKFTYSFLPEKIGKIIDENWKTTPWSFKRRWFQNILWGMEVWSIWNQTETKIGGKFGDTCTILQAVHLIELCQREFLNKGYKKRLIDNFSDSI